MSRASRARRGKAKRRKAAPKRAAIGPEIERGFRAIQEYIERAPSIPDDLGAFVAMSFELIDRPGFRRVMLFPRELAIACSLRGGHFDLASELLDEPPRGCLTVVSTTERGDYALRVADVHSITAPGGIA